MTELLLILLYGISALLGVLLVFRYKRSGWIPYVGFMALWGAGLASHELGPLVYPMMPEEFLWFMLVMWVVVTCGYSLGITTATGNHESQPSHMERWTWLPRVLAQLNRVSVVALLINLGFAMYKIVYFSNGNILAYIGDSSVIRYRFFEFTNQGAPLPYSLLELAAYSVFGIGVIGWFALGKYPRQFRWQPVVVLPLVSVLVLAVTSFSRISFLLYTPLALTAFIIGRPTMLRQVRWTKLVGAIVILLVTWMGVNWVAVVRDDGVSLSYEAAFTHLRTHETYSPGFGIIFSNYLYLTSSMVNFSDFLRDRSPVDQLDWGTRTFSSVLSPFRVLGVKVKTTDEVFADSGPTLREMLGYSVTLNAPTALRTLVQDWGIFGAQVFLFVLAFLTARLMQAGLRLSLVGVFSLSCCVLWIFMSPFVNVFATGGKALIGGLMAIVASTWYLKSRGAYVNESETCPTGLAKARRSVNK